MNLKLLAIATATFMLLSTQAYAGRSDHDKGGEGDQNKYESRDDDRGRDKDRDRRGGKKEHHGKHHGHGKKDHGQKEPSEPAEPPASEPPARAERSSDHTDRVNCHNGAASWLDPSCFRIDPSATGLGKLF